MINGRRLFIGRQSDAEDSTVVLPPTDFFFIVAVAQNSSFLNYYNFSSSWCAHRKSSALTVSDVMTAFRELEDKILLSINYLEMRSVKNILKKYS